MSKKIYKYKLSTTSIQQIEIPRNGEVLCVQVQNQSPCIWVLVDPNEPIEKRTFELFGTGHVIDESKERKYIGTYQFMYGEIVFHCFELLTRK